VLYELLSAELLECSQGDKQCTKKNVRVEKGCDLQLSLLVLVKEIDERWISV
jgi:hypothetical protein